MNATIPAAEVRKGDRVRKTINNRQDPRWGQEIELVVETVRQDGAYVTILGTSAERDHMDNAYRGGFTVARSVAVAVVR